MEPVSSTSVDYFVPASAQGQRHFDFPGHRQSRRDAVRRDRLFVAPGERLALSDLRSLCRTSATVKFWRTDKLDADGAPTLLRRLKLFNDKFPEVPVTSLSVLEDLSELAIGLGNGAVFLFSGDLIRDRAPRQILLKRDGPVCAIFCSQFCRVISLTTCGVCVFFLRSSSCRAVCDGRSLSRRCRESVSVGRRCRSCVVVFY